MTGAGLLSQEVKKPDQGGGDRRIKVLDTERLETARRILAQDMQRVREMGDTDTVSAEIADWSHRLMEDGLRLALLSPSGSPPSSSTGIGCKSWRG